MFPHVYFASRDNIQRSRLAVVEPAHGLAVSLCDVKLHLRVDHDEEDHYIAGLVEAATQQIDSPRGWLGRSLLQRTLRLTLDDVPPSEVYLPGPPIISVESVERRGTDDEFTLVDGDDYNVDLLAEPGLIWSKSGWGSMKGGPDTFRVTYQAGYETVDEIPRLVRQWIMCRVGDLYRDRETSIIGTTSDRLQHLERALDNIRIR